MKKTILTFLVLTLTYELFAQNDCQCLNYKDEVAQPDTVFILGNKSIAICDGFLDNGFVTEFTLKSCKDTSINKFYDATLEYKIELENDTLFLFDHRLLWNFDSQEFERTVWAIEKIWVENNEFKYNRIVSYQVNKSLKLDKNFLIEWESETKDDWSNNPKLISWTFQLSLTDHEIYEKYFKHFRDTFQIGGANAEYYNELNRMYKEKMKN
jgi:hypothetical protein